MVQGDVSKGPWEIPAKKISSCLETLLLPIIRLWKKDEYEYKYKYYLFLAAKAAQ